MARKKAMIARREPGYNAVLAEVVHLVEEARRASARSVNAVMTSAYWQIGRRIVEHEQGGAARAGYGEALLVMLAADLTQRFKRGFSVDRLETARLFYLAYPGVGISATPSRKLVPGKSATLSRKLRLEAEIPRFPLSWSHYVTSGLYFIAATDFAFAADSRI